VKLELRLDRDVVTAGDVLAGTVLVLEGGPSRALTLTARFCERSPSFFTVVFAESVPLHEGDLMTGEAFPFALRLPGDATPGVKGKHGELFWEVEAVSDERGLDTLASSRFEVAPHAVGGGEQGAASSLR
jgi:hypothetical protein